MASSQPSGSDPKKQKTDMPAPEQSPNVQRLELGKFSMSLSVKNLEASKQFYEKLGFAVVAGDASKNWLVLRNPTKTTTIGLFQGWDSNSKKLASFTDVRELQRQLKAKGVQLLEEADEKTTGPAHIFLMDPDGNPILIDQHV